MAVARREREVSEVKGGKEQRISRKNVVLFFLSFVPVHFPSCHSQLIPPDIILMEAKRKWGKYRAA
jgi:hypothetical protein